MFDYQKLILLNCHTFQNLKHPRHTRIGGFTLNRKPQKIAKKTYGVVVTIPQHFVVIDDWIPQEHLASFFDASFCQKKKHQVKH